MAALKENDHPDNLVSGIKEKIMRDIKEKRIKMRSPLVFAAEKLGLESALVTSVIAGALLVSVIFYFLKKTEALRSLGLGMPGIGPFFLALPYDYISLFILTIILAIYFANRIEIFCGECERTDRFAVSFLLIAILLGLFFAVMGVGDFLAG